MSSKILVIDDSEHLRAVIQMTLAFQGHNVSTAADGAEGLRMASEGSYDLIFSDIEMPVMDGIEFVRRFREAHGAATPILVLTAEEGEVLRAAQAAGATEVIVKPFEP